MSEGQRRGASGHRSPRRAAASFLVRLWEEPSAAGRVVRGSVRDLGTGEEHWIGDLDHLGEMLQRRFSAAEATAERVAGSPDREGAVESLPHRREP